MEKEALECILNCDVPIVDLQGLYSLENSPCFVTHDYQVACLAVNHLYEKGFREFAYCGFEGVNFSDIRQKMVQECVMALKGSIAVYSSPFKYSTDSEFARASLMKEELELAKWLQSLHKPIGLIACNDVRARDILSLCRSLGIRVPDQVAVVGVDNDDVICELSEPRLTSVEPDGYQIGYQAAVALDAMMRGDHVDIACHLLKPLGIVERQSTNSCLQSDKLVADVMSFIRDHACNGIGVNDVLNYFHVTRSTLHRRFTKAIGRSVKAELEVQKINRIKELLRESDYKLHAIARLVGFTHKEHMISVFKSHEGITPGIYRKKLQQDLKEN
jgi:LacI family transcriptional regulator